MIDAILNFFMPNERIQELERRVVRLVKSVDYYKEWAEESHLQMIKNHADYTEALEYVVPVKCGS